MPNGNDISIDNEFSTLNSKKIYKTLDNNEEEYEMPSYLQNISQITVADVYESAADIGKEFERLIDTFGADEFVNFMPKVVKILEELEALAERNEQDNLEISNLTYAVQRLEAEKAERKWEKLKYEKELEQIEDDWKVEANQLSQLVNRLKEENQKLSRKLEDETASRSHKPFGSDHVSNRSGIGSDSSPTSPIDSLNKDFQLMTVLGSTVEKLEKQLIYKEDEIKKKISENETMESQIMRLSKVCQELRRKNQTLQRHLRILIDDKTDQQIEIQDRDHQLIELKEKLTLIDQGKFGLFSGDMSQSLFSTTSDLSDDSPRFTLAELKEVLREKNELKARLMETEEELDLYKPKPPLGEGDEPVVQGPINREPDEKLHPWKYKKGPTGIRRFFRCLIRRMGQNNIDWEGLSKGLST